MKRRSWKRISGLLGYLLFFLTISVLLGVGIALYEVITDAMGGDKLKVMAVMFLVILALAGVCATIDAVRRKIMVEKPVNKILSATKKIAAGDFSVRIESPHTYERYDELDLIMIDLNKIATELGKSEMLKSDFISNVSHEIKTPLAVISNYATLMQTEKDAQKNSEYAKIILSATKRLNDLVTNVLKLNKLENQGVLPEKERVNLQELMAQIVIGHEEIIEKKNIQFDCDLAEVEIYSLPAYIELVVNNLLSNAIKFTESGGKVALSLKDVSDRVEISVEDTGCGISSENGARIFDKFYQGETSHSQEGNGLGLALVKKAIDILGGEISVKSQQGVGSTFRVILKK